MTKQPHVVVGGGGRAYFDKFSPKLGSSAASDCDSEAFTEMILNSKCKYGILYCSVSLENKALYSIKCLHRTSDTDKVNKL